MMERAERLHRQFFQPGPSRVKGPTWEPPVDIFETENEVGILVALPGVEPSQVEVVIDGNALIVAGARAVSLPSNAAVVHRLEIPHGRFERRIELVSGRLELRRRELTNGCLLLIFGKRD